MQTTGGLVLLIGFCLAAATAAAQEVPLPRPKPLAANPAISRTTGGVVIPRPKPPVPGASQTAQPRSGGAAIATTRNGRIVIDMDNLGRERDPDQASELTPTEATQWSSAEIQQARDRCAFVLAATNMDVVPGEPVGGPDGCGIAAPISVSAFGAVRVRPAAKINCTLAAALYKWVVEDVQPAALKKFKQPVVELRQLASYQCRTRRGVGGGRISEHAFGNALDIGTFTLANGEKVSVLDHWSKAGSFLGLNANASFLKKAHEGACEHFSTVLGPEANKAHENHFHFDLGRGGRYKICE